MGAPLSQLFKLDSDMAGLEKMIDALGVAAKASHGAEEATDIFGKKVKFVSDAVIGAATEANSRDAGRAEKAAQKRQADVDRIAERSGQRVRKAFERGARERQKIDEKAAKDAARAHEKAADEAMRHWSQARERENQEAIRSAEATSGRMKGFLKGVFQFALGNLAADGFRKLMGSLGDLPGNLLKGSASAERLDRTLGLQYGGKGEQLSGYAKRVAPFTPVDVDTMKSLLLEMGQSGVAFKDIDKNIAAAASAAGRMADPVAGFGKAVNVLNEATRKRVVSGSSLRDLGIGPEQLRVLNRYKNTDLRTLNRVLEEGEFRLFDVRKLLEGNNKLLGTVGVVAAGDMSNALKNLGEAGSRLFQEFKGAPVFDSIKVKLQGLADWLSPAAPGGAAFVTFFSQAGAAAQKFINGVDWKTWGDRLLKLMTDLGKVAGNLASAFEKVAWFAGKAFDLGSATVHGAKGIDSAVSKWMNGGSALGSIAKNYTPLGFFDTGKAVGEGLRKGIEASAPAAAAAAGAMASNAHAAAKNALDSHSPSRLAMGLGEDYAEGWGIGLAGGMREQRAKLTPDSFAGAPGMGGGPNLGGMTLSLGGITVNAGKDANAEDIAHATERHLASVLPAQLTALFGRLLSERSA